MGKFDGKDNSAIEKAWRDLSDEASDIWNANAAFWDNYMGEGNDFQKVLLAPTLDHLLNIKNDEHVLEIACGNGSYSRRLASSGAYVVAFDVSDKFIELARSRSSDHADRIDYKVIDATDYDQMLSLGEKRFDAAVCNMAMMDIADITPLLNVTRKLLKHGGRFVFSICHPCFNTSGIKKIIEEEDRDGEIITQYAIRISSYITPRTTKGLGVIGQPVPQYYFDRPLNSLFNQCFDAGFMLDRIEEPTFDGELDNKRPLSWANFQEIPPVLVARLRPFPVQN